MIAIVQLIVSIAIIALILLQERSAGGLGSLFGGGGGGEGFYQTRRGLEKIIFRATIALLVIFVGLSIWGLIAH